MTYLVVELIIVIVSIVAFIWATSEGFAVATIVGGFVLAIASGLWWLFCAATIVTAGTVAIPVWFGSVQQTTYSEGLHWINPMASTAGLSLRRDTIDFSNNKATGHESNPVNGPAILAISSDQNPLTIDVSFPYSINAAVAWKLYQRIGRSESAIESKLMETHARTSVSNVFARHSWVDATITSREQLAAELQKEFSTRVVDDLVVNGFTDAEARSAFTIGEPQVREVRPDDKLLGAIADRLATQQLLERQKILTGIAEQEAARRAQEGQGIANLFKALPPGFKADEIHMVLSGLAAKENADAIMKGIEKGSVQFMVVPGNTPVSVTQPK